MEMPSSTIKTVAIVVIVAAIGIYVLFQQDSVRAFQTIPGTINDFTAINVDGGRTTFQKEKGKATLIVLSASWCPTCMSEIPMLKNIYREFEGKDFKILMVSEDDNVKIASRFKKKYSLPWTVVHWNYDLMNCLGNPGVIPVSYLINEKDEIVQTHTGVFDEKELTKSIQKLLK